MNTEDNTYKKNLKLHIHRMTAVICSGLLVFVGGISSDSILVWAADDREIVNMSETPEKSIKIDRSKAGEENEQQKSLLSIRNQLEQKAEKLENRKDYQLRDFLENGTLREFIYEITPEQAERLPGDSSDTVISRENREQSKKRMQKLKKQIKRQLEDADGNWSVYVKDLKNEVSFSIHNQEMYAASLIKLFVMEKSFSDFDEIVANYNEIIKQYKIDVADAEGEAETFESQDTTEENAGEEYIATLLKGMIEVSDNEYYNELVKLQNAEWDFAEGAEELNEYIQTQGYTDTALYHTLHPAPSAQEWISMEQNHTSVEDCGLLLERIYDGECVSEEASEEMLQLLLNQQVVQKIPAGLPEDESVICANKTGETDTDHHDAAIVFGPKTDYVLCIMSSEWIDGQAAVETIQEISGIVYKVLGKTRLHEDSVWNNRSR